MSNNIKNIENDIIMQNYEKYGSWVCGKGNLGCSFETPYYLGRKPLLLLLILVIESLSSTIDVCFF